MKTWRTKAVYAIKGKVSPFLIPLILFTPILIVFWQNLSYDFVLWDDNLHLHQNPFVQFLTWNKFLELWEKPAIANMRELSLNIVADSINECAIVFRKFDE